MTAYMKKKWLIVKSCKAYKKVSSVVKKIQDFNDKHRHLLYIVSLVLSFWFNHAKIAQVENAFMKKDRARQQQLAECRERTSQLEISQLEQSRELDAWKLASFMYSGKHPEDSLFNKAIKSLIKE